MRRMFVVAALAVVVAGCAGPVGVDDVGGDTAEQLGTVEGISHDEELALSVRDGLNETELDLLAARSMARIELIRGLAFEERVDIELWTREEYQEWRGEVNASQERTRWENQVWQAKFIVGQDRDVTRVFDETLGEAVGGFYSPSEELVVVVADDERAAVDKRTLVHELVHVLQDQQFGLESPPARQDRSLARDGVVEGEAELIPELYFDRCESEWSCVTPPSDGGDTDIDPGIIRVLIHPYHQGPTFVETIRDRGGWDAVDGLHEEYPESTAQLIDPELYPDETPVNVTVEDRSTDEWRPIPHGPVRETVGQAGIYVMLWHNGIVSVEEPVSYSHPASDGWAGDELLPYAADDGESGYVWRIEWESSTDAKAFHESYHDLLAEHDAVQHSHDRFVISDGPYAGAYAVDRDGESVRIVFGPDVDSLAEIHDPGS